MKHILLTAVQKHFFVVAPGLFEGVRYYVRGCWAVDLLLGKE
jgi:hypothetical protein